MTNNTVQLSASSFELFRSDSSHAHHPDLYRFSDRDTVLVLDFTKGGSENNKLGTFHLLLDPKMESIEEVIWSPTPDGEETLVTPGSDVKQLPIGGEIVLTDNSLKLFSTTSGYSETLLDIKLDDFSLKINGDELSHHFIEELSETPNSTWTADNSITASRQDQTYANFMDFMTSDNTATDKVTTTTIKAEGDVSGLDAEGAIADAGKSKPTGELDSISEEDSTAVEAAIDDSDSNDGATEPTTDDLIP